MGDIVKQILARPIQVADQVTKWADDVQSFKQECAELKSKTEKLAGLLRQAARASSDLYERPTRRIIDDTEQVLDKAYLLVEKCRANGMKRLFTIIPANSFKKMSANLENSIGDVSWLLRVSASGDDRDDEYLGLPPIAANEPILCLIWEQIATLYKGSLDDRSDAAASLVSLARDNDRYGKLIIEEGGVGPLLKLVKEGRMEGQENAARAIGLLGRDPESVEHMIHAGVCSVFAKILKEGPMKVQSMVAWAVSELAANHHKCQDHFAQNNIIRLLVSHLAFETVQEHSKYAVTSNHKSIHSLVMANNDSNAGNNKNSNVVNSNNNGKGHEDEEKTIAHPMGNQNPNQMQNVQTIPQGLQNKPPNPHHHTKSSNPIPKHTHNQHNINLAGTSIKGREFEDPVTKATMKAMPRKPLFFLRRGVDDVQYNSAMALMEIAGPNSPAAKAVFDQLLRIIQEADSDLLIPCMRAMETMIIGPLVKLLDEREADVSWRCCNCIVKVLHARELSTHGSFKAIINAGGAKHLIQLVYFGEQMVQIPSLILLCAAQAEVLTVLEWSSKQGYMMQDATVETLLPEAKGRLELYQSRGSRGFH
ncbi:hypothetical protein MKW92_042650 [Papaver armeniacum]|nr:hypothetical protein MKW92_042650 [Papaver armeniacum]